MGSRNTQNLTGKGSQHHHLHKLSSGLSATHTLGLFQGCPWSRRDHLQTEELCMKTAVGSFLDSFTHGGRH